MYDELERALTGRPARKGLSPLGWLALSFGVITILGAVGIGYGVVRVSTRVKRAAHELGRSSPAAVQRAVAHLQRSGSVVSLDPVAGLAFLRGLQPGDPSEALVKGVLGPELGRSHGWPGAVQSRKDGPVGSTTSLSRDGDVHIDLTRGKNGGSLVIDSKDGRVRFDLVKSSTGGTLTIDSDDGHARFDFVRADGGGQLVIHSDQGTVELGVGSSSRGVPGWVPGPSGMPREPHSVFSLRTAEGLLGAVAWEDDATPGELVASYRASLEDKGYEVQDEESRSGPDGDEASLWARRERDGHTVFLLARRLDGRTHEVLGYGDGTAIGR